MQSLTAGENVQESVSSRPGECLKPRARTDGRSSNSNVIRMEKELEEERGGSLFRVHTHHCATSSKSGEREDGWHHLMMCPRWVVGRQLSGLWRVSSSGTVRSISSSFNTALESLEADAHRGLFLSPTCPPPARKDVLLLHPPGSCSEFTRSGSRYPPLGLNQLKAVIGEPSSVDVLEADGRELTNAETLSELRAEMPRAVGMTITCGTKKLVNAWATVAKNLSPGYSPVVIAGGPSVAFESREILRDCASIDVVVKGEGEVTFPKIVSVLRRAGDAASRASMLSELADIAGVVVRDAPPRMNDSTIPTLSKDAFEALPFPDMTSSPVHNYWAPDAKGITPMVTMQTQRGCPGKCGFCNTPQIHGQQMRGWSNEQIVAELLRLKAAHGIRLVSFVDDVFTNRPGGGPLKLCQMMVNAKLDLAWYCNARADGISTKIAAAMKAAGCFQVFLGFESGCDSMLRRINKGETVAQLERGAGILKDAGIAISIGFIVGLPGETQASVDKSIALCNRVQPSRVQFTRYTPIKGSPLASAHGLAASEGFHDRGGGDVVEAWLKQCYDECRFAPSI